MEAWSWTEASIVPSKGTDTSFSDGLMFKLNVFLSSFWAFFFTATVTSIIVRMLISSGVVIMFPIFMCMRRMGVNVDMHILALSYPWLGVPVEVTLACFKALS